MYINMFEFPRFAGFNIRSNKKCLLAWMDLFTNLMDQETNKVKAKSGKKNNSYETEKFLTQCQSIIGVCDKWNCKALLKKPVFPDF